MSLTALFLFFYFSPLYGGLLLFSEIQNRRYLDNDERLFVESGTLRVVFFYSAQGTKKPAL